jgi:hypothetical protein
MIRSEDGENRTPYTFTDAPEIYQRGQGSEVIAGLQRLRCCADHRIVSVALEVPKAFADSSIEQSGQRPRVSDDSSIAVPRLRRRRRPIGARPRLDPLIRNRHRPLGSPVSLVIHDHELGFVDLGTTASPSSAALAPVNASGGIPHHEGRRTTPKLWVESGQDGSHSGIRCNVGSK